MYLPNDESFKEIIVDIVETIIIDILILPLILSW